MKRIGFVLRLLVAERRTAPHTNNGDKVYSVIKISDNSSGREKNGE